MPATATRTVAANVRSIFSIYFPCHVSTPADASPHSNFGTEGKFARESLVVPYHLSLSFVVIGSVCAVTIVLRVLAHRYIYFLYLNVIFNIF
jgi:hypothetical protein